jgi:DNA-directed RNA polymerase subunit RPC12/RpoP
MANSYRCSWCGKFVSPKTASEVLDYEGNVFYLCEDCRLLMRKEVENA